jgi:hypothetical protein
MLPFNVNMVFRLWLSSPLNGSHGQVIVEPICHTNGYRIHELFITRNRISFSFRGPEFTSAIPTNPQPVRFCDLFSGIKLISIVVDIDDLSPE